MHEGIEGVVAAFLWDIVDDPNQEIYRRRGSHPEPYDLSRSDAGVIFQIFDRELDNLVDAPDVCEFIDAWKNRFSTGSEGFGRPSEWYYINDLMSGFNFTCNGGP